MKITKNELKSIVKECLVEILTEGVGTQLSQLTESTKKTPRKFQQIKPIARNQQTITSSALKEAIRLESGGNDVMAAILADTAEKTLPAMLENDKRKTAPITGKVESVVAAHNPEDLFGEEAASKWADLAFMGTIKK